MGALDCLRHALYHAPLDMRDTPLVGLANIMHRAGLYNDAIIAANLALEISPRVVVTHFTLANIYASKVTGRRQNCFIFPRLLYNQHLNQLWKDYLQSSVMKNSVHDKIYKCCDKL